MNNEPVIWINDENGIAFGKTPPKDFIHSWKPLYTHPVKELTDEEIDAIGDEVSSLIDTYAGRRNFARAILRKAQEK